MNPDISDELYNEAMKDIVDKCYWEQYEELFPDIAPPIENLEELNVGDCILDSDMFISTVLEAYKHEVELAGFRYKPPHLVDISEYIKEYYIDEIMYMEEEGLIDEGTVISFMADESAVLAEDIDPRICEVLDALEMTYLQRDYIKYIDFKTETIQSKQVNDVVVNTSATSLFGPEFKSTLIDRKSKEYEQSVQEGYNNLLRIRLDYL